MLPGSRQSEVRQLADLFVKTAKLILKEQPVVQFLVPLITRETRTIFEKAIYANEEHTSQPDIEGGSVTHTDSFWSRSFGYRAADTVIVASGTATLEAALLKRPMVITYRMPTLSWQLLKRMNYLPYVGLPNILARRFIVPELLQHNATPEKLAEAALKMMNDKVLMREIRAGIYRDA